MIRLGFSSAELIFVLLYVFAACFGTGVASSFVMAYALLSDSAHRVEGAEKSRLVKIGLSLLAGGVVNYLYVLLVLG